MLLIFIWIIFFQILPYFILFCKKGIRACETVRTNITKFPIILKKKKFGMGLFNKYDKRRYISFIIDW